MKRCMVIMLLGFIFTNICFSYNGEFVIQKMDTSSTSLHLQMKSIGGVWSWNEITETVYYEQAFDTTFDAVVFRFDAPKDNNVAPNGEIPWTLMEFTLSSGSASITFTIDFRDERWSTDYSYGDIYLNFNTETGNANFQPKGREDGTYGDITNILNNHTYNIWVVYNENLNVEPVIYNFYSPVYLNNIILQNSNEINAGGTLKINSSIYSSGETAWVLYENEYQIGTDNERFSNFQNSGVTYKHNNWNKKSTDYLLSRPEPIWDKNYIENAYFNPLNYCKIEARLETAQIPGKGDFQFKDPWFVLNDGTQPENYWITANGSYEPTGKVSASEKGVFLDQIIAPNKPYYSVKASQTQNINLGGSLGTRAFYFQNWSANTATSASLQNANALETGVVFKEPNATVSANYKGHLLSNSSAACANNGQRKVVRDKNGIYHMVYESMGKIWYSKSVTTNYQGEWTPDEKLLDYGSDLIYSNPSLSVNTTTVSQPDVYLSIVFEVKEDPNVAEVTGVIKNLTTGTSTDLTAEPIDVNFFGNAKPVIASFADEVFVVYKESSSSFLKYLRYYLNGSGLWTRLAPLDLPAASASAINPTVAANTNPTRSQNLLQIAWQQAPSSIKYQYSENIERDNPGSSRIFTTKDVSFGSGNTYNSNPSIIDLDGAGARIAWYGTRKLSQTEYQYRTVFKNPSTNTFWNFGSNVGLPSINKIDDYTDFILGWSENNGSNGYFADNSLSSITPLNIPGKDLQFCNGSSKSTMYATSFSNNTLPYFFSQSNNIQSLYLSKTNAAGINKGREGVVAKGSGEIYFTIGDVNVNGENISFTTLPDSFTVTSVNDINNNVRTIPFAISDNSQFNYSVQYGITDSAEVVNSLSVTAVQNKIGSIEKRGKIFVLDRFTHSSKTIPT